MHLGFFQYQVQLCRICNESVSDHAEDCPYKQLENIDGNRPNIQCCKCGGRVEANTSDYYECRMCNTQYSRSGFHEDLGWEKTVLIDLGKDEAITVLVMPDKGRGEFKVDRDMARVQRLIDESGTEEED